MKSIMTQLASIDAKVEDKDALTILLKSMPNEYGALVTTLKNLPYPKFEGCVASLLEKEKELKNGATTITTNGTNEQALYTNKGTRKCYHCGRLGHYQSECRFKNKPKCGHCNKLGHKEEACRLKNQEANYMESSSSSKEKILDDQLF